MSIYTVGTNSNTNLCFGIVQKKEETNEAFAMQEVSESSEKSIQTGVIPKQYIGASFADLINSSQFAKNQIPVVNKIVSSRSADDGEIYVSFFTDEKITCNDASGKKVWEINIENERQADKVKEYFANYKPDRDYVQEFYSGYNMKMALSRDFWIDLFKDVS